MRLGFAGDGCLDSSVASRLLSLELLLVYFTLFDRDLSLTLHEIPILLKSLSLR